MSARGEQRDEQRSRRIREIRKRIDRGEYRVSAEAVADSLIAWYRRMDMISRR
ncbi:MAG TPA: flagellar biosynthesis anti-sigma factor FlgM [Acidimicrobiia bacterium]|nr:flagellar biosynthesis anti-sigma factor FlgM [Acidimicrobiia bacterium]